MSGFLRATAVGVVLLAGLLVVVIEGICWWKGSEWRGPLYWGGAAGFGLNLLGYPFMLKLAALPESAVKSGSAISWWVAGVLVRLAGIAGMMVAIKGRFPSHEREAVLTAVAVYMAGMFAELAWLARRFNSMDKK